MYKFLPKLPAVSRKRTSNGVFAPMFTPEELAERRRLQAKLSYHKNKARCRIAQKEYYAKNRLSIRAQQADWQKGIGKDTWLKSHREYEARNPHKVAARRKVSNALQAGTIQKLACAQCGSPRAQAHHPDYSKPLEVIWLCRKHHQEEHNRVQVPA
jgi:hypothetical protein